MTVLEKFPFKTDFPLSCTVVEGGGRLAVVLILAVESRLSPVGGHGGRSGRRLLRSANIRDPKCGLGTLVECVGGIVEPQGSVA